MTMLVPALAAVTVGLGLTALVVALLTRRV